MRIGLEMFGTQTDGRNRGIGRYCRNLAAALRAKSEARGHEFVFYAVDGLPTDFVPEGPNAVLRRLRPEPHLRDTLNRLVETNPDGLDVLVFVNPLEMNPGLDIPARRPEGVRPALAAVVHDLIPLLFQDRYLRRWPGTSFARRYLWSLERLRTYDRLLANSEATRADLLRVLNLSDDRVVAVGAAGDDHGSAFGPDPNDPADLDAVRGLGIDGPFVFTVAGPDPHKNLDGLIDAFALLPPAPRAGHRLVVAAGAAEAEKLQAVRRRAEAAGVVDCLVLLSRPVDDRTLRALYRRCAAFAFPSLYEGFGLPVLEALRCGAAVVTGNRSSLPEVAGDAAILVDPSDPSALAGALASILTNTDLAHSLRKKGPSRARLFTWDAVADRVVATLEDVVAETKARPLPHPFPARKMQSPPRPHTPRIAFFSPLPPDPSGVADYAASLLSALGDRVAIDLFHDARVFPFTRFQGRGFGCFDYRLFERLDRVRPYRTVVYQMGNSPAHVFIEEALRKRPGVVVLHDLALASFHYEQATRYGVGLNDFRRALEESHPDRADEFDHHMALWADAPEAMVRGLVDAGLDMNGGIVAAADTVIVHSHAAAVRLGPRAAGKVVVIPHGADPTPSPPTPAERTAARARLGLPNDARVVGNYGIVHPSKQNVELIEAFAEAARAMPEVRLLVVGEEADDGLARRRAGALGLGDRVRFIGRVDDDRFRAAVVAADFGVALRRPPTNGETSGALLHLLRAGVPAVASDVGSFAEYPDGVVRKVPRIDGPAGVATLAEALLDLAKDSGEREALGQAGLEHVRRHHAWPHVADRYAEVIVRGGAVRGPHRVRGHVLRPAEAWERGEP